MRRPTAWARVKGSEQYPDIRGTVKFFPAGRGTVVLTELWGLPRDGFFAMHIHEKGDCSGNMEDPFANVGAHFDRDKDPHPEYSGDLPVVLSNGGYAWSAVYTDRFTPRDVMGRSVIIHLNPDDYRTQPSGASGNKIACGRIGNRW